MVNKKTINECEFEIPFVLNRRINEKKYVNIYLFVHLFRYVSTYMYMHFLNFITKPKYVFIKICLFLFFIAFVS